MLLSYPRPIDLVTPIAALGVVGRLLAPVVRLDPAGRQPVLGVWLSVSQRPALLLRERIQVLHLNNGVSVGNELLVASKLLGIRCVIHQRGIAPITPWSGWLARRADHVICVSEAARQNLISQGLEPERCTAIHNGINMAELLGKIKRTSRQVRQSLGIARRPGHRRPGRHDPAMEGTDGAGPGDGGAAPALSPGRSP